MSLPLALLFARYRFPGKTLLNSALLAPLILPPFVGAIGLKHLFARFGSVNLLLDRMQLVSLENPIDWFGASGIAGVILMEVLHLFPIMYLSLAAALGNIDPSLRDAASNLGAGPFRVLRTVTFPLLVPGLFAGTSIVFVSAFTDLGTPLIFDMRATVPTQIFSTATEAGTNPVAYALVVITLVLVSVLFLVGKKLGDTGSYAMMSRSATIEHVSELRGARGWLVTAGVVFVIFISVVPHMGVLLTSVAGKWFFTVLPSEPTGRFYGEIFTTDLTMISVRNSLFYASCSALLDVVLGVTIAHLLAREKFFGKAALDVIAMLPLALPGIVLALSLIHI
jgi:iron(III) transport system permease protein